MHGQETLPDQTMFPVSHIFPNPSPRTVEPVDADWLGDPPLWGAAGSGRSSSRIKAAAGGLTFVHYSAIPSSQYARFISGIQHGGARCLCFHVSKTNGFEWASRWW